MWQPADKYVVFFLSKAPFSHVRFHWTLRAFMKKRKAVREFVDFHHMQTILRRFPPVENDVIPSIDAARFLLRL